MRKSEVFDRCIYSLTEALKTGKIKTKWLTDKGGQTCFHAGITVSSSMGEAGPISRAWGIVFNSPDRPLRCTQVHVSYYGESVVLSKLLEEIEKMTK